jgi:hypothetical protein
VSAEPRDEPSAWEIEASRSLIASVEELRALLARLPERDRERVIRFARELLETDRGDAD